MPKHALILDADYLVFSAMCASETETQWEDNVWTLECDHNLAWRNLISSVEAIIKRYKKWETAKLVMCFTDTVNWRKDILPTYKMNRKATRKPTGYYAFVERVMACDQWQSFLRPTLEGDDCMGILATKPSLVDCTTATICSPDKDFKTIPCEFYWMKLKGDSELLHLSEEDADYWHMYQTIIGDTTDGYTGIKGVGEVIAKEFLDKPYKWSQVDKELKSGPRKGQVVTEWKKVPANGASLWECMVSLAAKNGVTEEELLAQAQVARICRISDYNLRTKEVIHWKP